MAKVIPLSRPRLQDEDSFDEAMKAIEKRFGVSFWDYIGLNGRRPKEVQERIDKALQKETFDD
ncbi:MAG: hypothetical protein BAA01_00110 [Bacillus thermozeamaize]|uniref:Uncharacterized protein n=1 Tax=Bacillus thermozeamaize TaxID=230954 RepID=A0A1Y3PDF1_9BACI|nr:MAG: hypothetical protein BAA01_00110 [Bacillus thermozeamaize]